MSVSIEFYYSFQSPYSYVALDSVYELENHFDVELIWQPFSAKAAGQQVTPMPVLPEKLSYLMEDVTRYAKDRSLPLQFPENWPETEFEPGRITRGALAAQDLGVLMEYNLKVFHKIWGLGENPNEETFITELCEELDVDIGDFLSKLSSSDTRERIKGIYKRGRGAGVYDTPTFVINNEERIVGVDRVSYVAERLTKLGLKKRAAA